MENNDKHPTEIIQELDNLIDKHEKAVKYHNEQLVVNESLLTKLQQRKQSLINYLNHDDE